MDLNGYLHDLQTDLHDFASATPVTPALVTLEPETGTVALGLALTPAAFIGSADGSQLLTEVTDSNNNSGGGPTSETPAPFETDDSNPATPTPTSDSAQAEWLYTPEQQEVTELTTLTVLNPVVFISYEYDIADTDAEMLPLPLPGNSAQSQSPASSATSPSTLKILKNEVKILPRPQFECWVVDPNFPSAVEPVTIDDSSIAHVQELMMTKRTRTKTKKAAAETSKASVNSTTTLKKNGGTATATKKERPRRLFFCDVCKKGFSAKYTVEVHQRIHTGERPFACLFCGVQFRQKAHLLKHLRIHAPVKAEAEAKDDGDPPTSAETETQTQNEPPPSAAENDFKEAPNLVTSDTF